MERPPHPALRATFSREGRRKKEEAILSSPSPLAGEGGSRHLRETDEGAAVKFARHLRKNMTEAEKALWSALRDRRFDNFKFRRQVPVGKYIADFLCFEHRLVIEVDGGQHSESVKDVARDAWLASQGFRTLRFWNVDVFQALDGTMLAILDALKQCPSSGASRHPGSSPGQALLPQAEKEGNES